MLKNTTMKLFKKCMRLKARSATKRMEVEIVEWYVWRTLQESNGFNIGIECIEVEMAEDDTLANVAN